MYSLNFSLLKRPFLACVVIPEIEFHTNFSDTAVVMSWKIIICLVIQSDLFGMVKWPFKGLSDLQLGDEKGTLKNLVGAIYFDPKQKKTFNCEIRFVSQLQASIGFYATLTTWSFKKGINI